MALPKIEVEVTADTTRAEKGLDRVERGMRDVGSAADHASTRTTRLSGSMNRTSGMSNRFRGQIQNTAFQLGDFATQVGAGTSASVALGQQLPQLLGGFGALGAVLGVVAAVAVPLSRALSGMAGDAEMAEKALGVLHPAALAVADAFGKVRDIGVQMAEVIINNLDRILITAGTVAAFFAGKWVAAFVAARVATFSLVGALTAFKAALIRTGVGALVVAAGELVYRFIQLVEASGSFSGAIALIGEVFSEVWGRMKQGVSLLGEMFGGLGMIIKGAFQTAFGAVATAFNDYVMTPIVKGFNTLIDAANSFGANFNKLEMPTLGEGISGDGAYNLEGGQTIVSSAAGALGGLFSDPLSSIQKIRDLLAGMKEEGITLGDILGQTDGEGGEGGGGGGDGSGRGQTLAESLMTKREQLENWYAEQKEILASASEDELAIIGGYNEAKLRLEAEYQRRLARLKEDGNKSMISETLSAGKTILQAVGQTNEKAFKIAQAFGAAEVLVNAFVGASKELKEKGVIGIATAASVIAAGVGFVSSLQSIKPNTAAGGATGGATGGFGGGGGSTSAPAPATAPQVSRDVAIKLEGRDFGRDQVIDLINEINEAVEDGAVVRLA